MSRIEIVLADDHPVVCAGLHALLACEQDFRVIGTAHGGGHACRLVREHAPTVALLDVRMPDGDGITVLEHIASERIPTRGIVLTTYDDVRELARARAAGAWAYLLKDAPKMQLFSTIRRVAKGERVFPDTALRMDPAIRDGAGSLPWPSPRELEVLQALSRGESNRSIAKRLFISEATVKTHVRHIFEKLGKNTRAGALFEAVRRGWIAIDPSRRDARQRSAAGVRAGTTDDTGG